MSDVEALAEFLREVEADPQRAADPQAIVETRNWTREARAILASNWLAEHDAEVEARVREQIAQAIECTDLLRDDEYGDGIRGGLSMAAGIIRGDR